MDNILSWYDRKLYNIEFYRLGVMAFMLLVHANIVVPATLLAISMNSGSSIEFGICAVLSFALLGALLSGVKVKKTIPLFLFSVVVHLYIVLSNFIYL